MNRLLQDGAVTPVAGLCTATFGATLIYEIGLFAAPLGPVTVAPGSIVPGNHITLIGTPARCDQFAGP